ncbi:ABC-2 type transport system ATP-binding protein [Virgibacillus natechei]|uniref:ABC-2 type transport system ATP-binding protein n=1 Tax=Virgibacillus natechei TaxID=1216297 RepID=A0ABS4II94_9BACI|nr:ATP-binding cassette domain-containing protein [Virgibacillus natechei]MBP1970669.1 ABC-2 type transport system ATP-binding protein [Virgibacillus natechei]UZD13947.1 ATP-binding cassette domain-containing protein [Virgibacillus natechei]
MHIEAKNLHLAYGSDQILHDINVEITEPKIYGLLGRNGAGKTSLLSLFGSFREPTSGKLLMDGEEPFENAGIMQQVTFMYNKDFTGETDPPSSVIKHIKRYRPNFNLDYAEELLKKFKLEEKKPLQKLSTGKQSAFNVVVGLASRSPITIFDEVYLGMDAPARDLFYKELLKEQEIHPRIMILSTHLVSEMDYLFDEVIIINEGNLLLHESYDDLVSRGVTVVGNKLAVDAFAKDKEVLNEEQLGDTRSITLYGALSEADKASAKEQGLNIGPVSLQDLFIQLTKEEH